MNRCLIMITTSFPFTSGEPYLETELPYAAQSFDRVLLFTIGLDRGAQLRYTDIPQNVIVCNPSKGSAKKAKLLDLIHGLPALFRFGKKYKSEAAATGRSPLKRLFAGYLISRSERHCNEIYNCISDIDFSVFDEVVLYGYWLFAAAATAVLLKEKIYSLGAKKVRVISRAHSYDVYEYANRLNFLPLRCFLLKNLDGVYTCSENGREYILKKHPEYSDKISVSYLGTEGGIFTKGSDDGVFRILTCSRTIPLKRLDRLVRALALLDGKGLKLSWTHIGDGPSLDEIKLLADEKLGFMNVSFKGEMAHDDVIDYMRENTFDLFVNVSQREGLPVSVMEAISFGIVCAVTDVGGCREIITDGVNGFVLPSDVSDEELSRCIFCASQKDLSEMRRNAFDIWQKKFTASKNYSGFINKTGNI